MRSNDGIIPCPRMILAIFGAKISAIVTDVDSCVLTNPSKYLISGPACGKMNKLQIKDNKLLSAGFNISGKKLGKTHWNATIIVLTIAML